MDWREGGDSEARFEAYLSALIRVVGHADRAGPMRAYCQGLLLPAGRKSVEPMAALTAPARAAAQHQSLLHFVGNAPWSDEALLREVRALVLPSIERSGPIEAWIIDDTGFPKKGRHSVGVARQYCGQLGKQDNCQVAVSLSIANRAASLPVAWRLYLPKDWAADPVRRRKAGVPETVSFRTKPEIALAQLRDACSAGLSPGVVLMDAGYGNDTDLRSGVTALGLRYAVGINPNTSVWTPDTGPLPPKARSGRGAPSRLVRRDAEHQPVAAKALALGLPRTAWQTVTWREGSADWLSSRFARIRVRPAHRDYRLTEPRAEEWLMVEWPETETEPTKYWLSTLAEDIDIARMVDLTKLRWRIERDYQDLKQELGLGHYEGRGWRGFHHHAALCVAAYGFLVAERAAIPPSGLRASSPFQAAALPPGYRPRGAAAEARAPRPKLDLDDPKTHRNRYRQEPPTMSMLQSPDAAVEPPSLLMTQ